MALVDQVELLGAAIEDGIITRTAAAELLVEHAGGKLSIRGALHYLDKHRTMRAEGAERMAGIAALLACIQDVDRAATPEEEAAAGLRMEAEIALQQEIQHQRMRAEAWRLLRRNARRDETN